MTSQDSSVAIDFGTSKTRILDYKGEDLQRGMCIQATTSVSSSITPASKSLDLNVTLAPGSIYDIKRLLGGKMEQKRSNQDLIYPVVNGKVACPGQDKWYTPEEAAKVVLANARNVVGKVPGNLTKALITVPVCFNNAQRQALKNAAVSAGFTSAELIPAPTAAALAYFQCDKGLLSTLTNVLIFDLGGGTLDVSILDIGPVIKVKATAGNIHLGGLDFDSRLVAYFVEEFRSRHNKDLTSNVDALYKLREAAEKAKHELSTSTVTTVDINSLYEGVDFRCSVTRATFEDLCWDLFQAMELPLWRVSEDAGTADLNRVLMLGGSSKIPKVQEIVRNFFGKVTTLSSEDLVFKGAEMQARLNNFKLQNVTPFSLYIQFSNHITKLVSRNTPIPFKEWEYFPNKTVIRVYEGESPFMAENNLLGEFDLGDSGTDSVEVVFEIGTDGMFSVSPTSHELGKFELVELGTKD